MIIKILLILFIIITIYALLILFFSFDNNIDDADYLIVLGHKLNNDKPSEVLIHRLNKTIEYVNKNINTNIVLSGGITSKNSVSEAYIMKEYLINHDISEDRLFLEDKSIDTVENIKNCLNYIDKKSKVVIISSNYHIVRARMICRLLGLDVKGIGVYTPVLDLLKHLIIEEIFIIIHYIRIKKTI